MKHAMRKAAKGKACTLGLPGCVGGGSTTVLAHIPRLYRGIIGLSRKCPDWFGAFTCRSCHDIIDLRVLGRFDWNSEEDRHEAWRAMHATRKRYCEEYADRSTQAAIAALLDLAQVMYQAEAWPESDLLQQVARMIDDGITFDENLKAKILASVDAITPRPDYWATLPERPF